MPTSPIRFRTVIAMALLATAATLAGYLLGRSNLSNRREPPSQVQEAGEDAATHPLRSQATAAETIPVDSSGSPASEVAIENLDAEEQVRLRRIVGGMWWHRGPMRELLELDDVQVASMDELCRAHLLRRWQLRGWQQREDDAGAGLEVQRALAALDLEAAGRALEERAAQLGWLATADGRLEVAVLGQLRAEQLEVLARERPVLLRRPWLKSVGRGSVRAPRGGESVSPGG